MAMSLFVHRALVVALVALTTAFVSLSASAQNDGPMRAATADDYQREVVEYSNSGPVVVMALATWCGPCRQVQPRLAKAAQALGVKLVVVDVDENPDSSAALGVAALPTLALFKHGKAVGTLVGSPDDEKIVNFLLGR